MITLKKMNKMNLKCFYFILFIFFILFILFSVIMVQKQNEQLLLSPCATQSLYLFICLIRPIRFESNTLLRYKRSNAANASIINKWAHSKKVGQIISNQVTDTFVRHSMHSHAGEFKYQKNGLIGALIFRNFLRKALKISSPFNKCSFSFFDPPKLSHDRQNIQIVGRYLIGITKECSENKFLISERVNSIHFEPGLR